jgi:hypothetical protein
MAFIKTRRNQLLLAWPLAAVVTALTVTACGGNSGASNSGASPGHWTHAEVSKFASASGSDGSTSQDSCISGYFARDMSFANAMDVVAVAPASASMSPAQIEAAVVSKYGTAKGHAIDGQFRQVITDASSQCSGSATSSTAPAAAPAPDPAPTSESSCSVDCVNPVPSGESGWLAQVQGALSNVQQDLTAITSDSSSDPETVALDGSELEQDAQAALDPSYDPPPADNADWLTAMNDYVTAGEDYAGDNENQQDDNPAQANQELGEANAALAAFNSANGGVLKGTIQPG